MIDTGFDNSLVSNIVFSTEGDAFSVREIAHNPGVLGDKKIVSAEFPQYLMLQ